MPFHPYYSLIQFNSVAYHYNTETMTYEYLYILTHFLLNYSHLEKNSILR